MNAHINLDLGVAAAQTAPGPSLAELRRDFDAINEILGNLLDVIQSRINQLSPAMRLVDCLGGRSDEQLFQFRMELARDGAWELAESLSTLSGPARQARIARRDAAAVRVANMLLRPPLILRAGARVAGLFESRDVRRNIDVLAEPLGAGAGAGAG